MTRLEEIKERVEKADRYLAVSSEMEFEWDELTANAYFMAHARQDIPYLLALVDKQREVLEAWKQWEADLIGSNEAWDTPSGLPMITQELYERWCASPNCLQQMREEALTYNPEGEG